MSEHYPNLINFDEIIDSYSKGEISDNCLIDTVKSYREMQKQKDQLFDALRKGCGLQELLKIAYKFVGNPFTLVDSSYSILASYPTVSDERTLEIKNNRLSIKNVFSNDMKVNKITERIYHSIYPFTSKIEDFPYDWVFESIRINQAVVGYICCRGINKEFSEEDLAFIHDLSKTISVELQKDFSFSNPKGIKYDHFFKELFLKHFDNEENIKNQLKLFGVKPESNYYLLAFDFISSSERVLSPDYYCNQIMSILTNSVTGTYNGIIITLVPTHTLKPYSEENRERLVTFLQMNNMIATLSFVFTNLMESHTYFDQCQSMLTLFEPSDITDRILLYGDYCFRHISNIIDNPEVLQASIHPALKFIKKYDEENETEYLLTLQTYIQKNRSAPAAAEALHIHKSTFFYRIEKMKSLFGIDISNPDNMFAYEISLKLMKISK
ncbi:PucR family transcriptional regulator [Pseudobutyrivibrio sp.]|uniref:PucR family transcriptional regulator n=1 Tax=Pseudobutyrivibrio sp. TaxID=2014367 RepID=UPI001D38AF7E|nr:helix-turn-helix domain-containing protein [Pseudobutyrivibrio sp.]MBE5910275.1 hypothetical protein [Pseudobutyrivibrio sp.]